MCIIRYMQNEQILISSNDLRAKLSLSKTTFYRLISQGVFRPVSGIRRNRLFPLAQVERFLATANEATNK